MNQTPLKFQTEQEAEAWLNANYRHKWSDGYSAGPIYANEHGEGIQVVHGNTRLEALTNLADEVLDAINAGKL